MRSRSPRCCSPVSPPRKACAAAVALGCALALSLAAGSGPAASATRSGPTATLLAVGDIASCSSVGDEQTAALLARLPGTIAAIGDIAYPNGSAEDFARCFAPSWGPLVPRIKAALGNHEYNTGTAAVAIRTFGLPQRGWYSYGLGAWHVIVLNGNCGFVDGCGRGSPQWRWLAADLARHPVTCTLAYWHQPRYSSGLHGSNPAYQPFWDLLARAGADVVLGGHDHDYERFAPIRGIREFVVGTGGASHYPTLIPQPSSVVRGPPVYGVLRLVLRPGGYTWRFISTGGSTFTDTGSAAC
jgi:acid phosphatase type 7